ncbi:hypothetical protein ACJJTC_012571 [Scirpophaga incertulas]
MKLSQILLTVVTLSCVYCRFIKRKTTHPINSKEVKFPDNMDPMYFAHLQVPSDKFCSEMDLEPSLYYVVLPWWYHHCQALKEKNFNSENIKVKGLYQYKRMLANINEFRRRGGFKIETKNKDLPHLRQKIKKLV